MNNSMSEPDQPASGTVAALQIEGLLGVLMQQVNKERGKWPVRVRQEETDYEITAITAEKDGTLLLRVKPIHGADEKMQTPLDVQDSREIHWEGADSDVLRIHLIRTGHPEDLFLAFDSQRRGWVMSAAFMKSGGPEIIELGFLPAWSGKITPPPVARAVAYVGNVIQFADGHKALATEDGPIAIGARVLCERPHADRDYSYQCGRSYCRCMKPLA